MPPHVKRRKDRDGSWYLIDGRIVKSLKTKVRRYAEARLDQYIRGKFSLGPKITVGEYYERWIETKKEPMVRKSAVRDYRQAFLKYILPACGDKALCSVSLRTLQTLRDRLLTFGGMKNGGRAGPLSLKTVKNILAGSFRALWKDAMIEEIVDRDPFIALQWPAPERLPPDPFTLEERDQILAEVRKSQAFYYPFVYCSFYTGMRPSEAVALRLSDLDHERCTISITKSRHLGAEAKPKTLRSRRLIAVSRETVDLLDALRLPWHTKDDHVFYNKISGGPLDPNQWARIYWAELLKAAGVRHRKFYATRHSFITDMVQRGENLKAIADYCGTSVEMIERNYCGRLSLSHLPNPNQKAPKSLGTLVVPTGIEPAPASEDKFPKPISARLFERLRKAQGG